MRGGNTVRQLRCRYRKEGKGQLERVSCHKCGGEIKYIALRDKTVIVDTDYVEVITDRGRVVEGHIRHKCPENKDIQSAGNGVSNG